MWKRRLFACRSCCSGTARTSDAMWASTLTSTTTTSSSSTWPSSSAGTTMTLAGLLASDQSPLLSEFNVAYSDYDWSLNESKADR